MSTVFRPIKAVKGVLGLNGKKLVKNEDYLYDKNSMCTFLKEAECSSPGQRLVTYFVL